MDLTPEQFRLVATIFEKACQIPEKERHDFLDEACGEDAALRTQVQQLLDDDAQPAFSLESPPFEGVLQAGGASYFENQNSQAKPLERIGNYRIVKVLGEGGFGVVYLAEQENPKRKVALKVVKPHMGSGEMLRRFEYEARLLGRLRHPGIAHIYEAGTVESKSYSGELLHRPFFAMELVRGKRLTTHADDAKLGTRQRLVLLQKVCEAVHHAHLQGVIHRDLKPDNILVDDSGQPKILDFGVARAIDSDIQMTTLRTDIGQLIGTIPYMSPEQVLGDSSKVDIRSDVYAIGVIGYELLVGRLPHDLSHKTVPEAVRIIRDVQPTPLSSANRVFRGDLDTMFAKALEKDKTRRYQSAAEFAADLERYLKDQPLLARPPSTIYQFRKFAKRNKALVGGVAATFFALVIGVIATTSQAVRATQANRQAQTEREIAEEERNRAVSAEAQAEQRRAQAEAEAVKAQTINDFLQDMLSSVNPRNAKNPQVGVREILDEAVRQIESGSFAEQPSVEATVRMTLGNTYKALGLYKVAEINLRAALEIGRAEFGQDHPFVLESLVRLGEVLYFAGDYVTSERYYREARSAYRKLSLNQKEAAVLSNLGVLLEKKGDYDASENLAREALAIRREILDEAHPEIGSSLNNLGVVLRKKGDYAGAEEAYREALDLNRKHFGNEHVEVATNLANLGLLTAYRGSYDEAAKLLREALRIRRRMLGDEHPRVTTTLNGLAGVLHQLGDYDRAEEMYREALRLRRKSLGDQHPRVATVMYNLAVLLSDKGDAAEALPFAFESLDIFRKGLPGSGPDVDSSLYATGRALLMLDRPAEAEVYMLEALAMRENRYAAGHLRIVLAKSSLGACMAAKGRFTEAEPVLVDCYERVKQQKGDEDRTTKACLERVIELYESWDAAEPGNGYDVKIAEWRAKLPKKKDNETTVP